MNRFLLHLFLFVMILAAAPPLALAQTTSATVVSACGTPPATYTAGANRALTQDTTGKLCDGSGGGGSTTANQGTPNAGGALAWPVQTTPTPRTLVTLDVKTVTTGGTPVTAIAAGHRTAGAVLCNPQGATINLGINEIGTASGTTSSGDTTFITPGQCYRASPAAGGVSVITSDSTHPFSGYGLN